MEGRNEFWEIMPFNRRRVVQRVICCHFFRLFRIVHKGATDFPLFRRAIRIVGQSRCQSWKRKKRWKKLFKLFLTVERCFDFEGGEGGGGGQGDHEQAAQVSQVEIWILNLWTKKKLNLNPLHLQDCNNQPIHDNCELCESLCRHNNHDGHDQGDLSECDDQNNASQNYDDQNNASQNYDDQNNASQHYDDQNNFQATFRARLCSSSRPTNSQGSFDQIRSE